MKSVEKETSCLDVRAEELFGQMVAKVGVVINRNYTYEGRYGSKMWNRGWDYEWDWIENELPWKVRVGMERLSGTNWLIGCEVILLSCKVLLLWHNFEIKESVELEAKLVLELEKVVRSLNNYLNN